MSDIVERLASWRTSGLAPECYKAAIKDMTQARDEIERLRKRVQKLEALLRNPVRSDDGYYDYMQEDVDAALKQEGET